MGSSITIWVTQSHKCGKVASQLTGSQIIGVADFKLVVGVVAVVVVGDVDNLGSEASLQSGVNLPDNLNNKT